MQPRCSMLVVCAFALAATASAAGTVRGNCYPENTVVIDPGATHANGTVFGYQLEEYEIERLGVETDHTENIAIAVDFRGDISASGKLSGFLNITITYPGGKPQTMFYSSCAQEIQTSTSTGNQGLFEAEFEGIVYDFPGYEGTGKPSVGSINVKRNDTEPSKVDVEVSIELGFTCYEDNTGLGDIELAKVTLSNQNQSSFNITNAVHGAWSFPPGKDSQSCSQNDF